MISLGLRMKYLIEICEGVIIWECGVEVKLLFTIRCCKAPTGWVTFLPRAGI